MSKKVRFGLSETDRTGKRHGENAAFTASVPQGRETLVSPAGIG